MWDWRRRSHFCLATLRTATMQIQKEGMQSSVLHCHSSEYDCGNLLALDVRTEIAMIQRLPVEWDNTLTGVEVSRRETKRKAAQVVGVVGAGARKTHQLVVAGARTHTLLILYSKLTLPVPPSLSFRKSPSPCAHLPQ